MKISPIQRQASSAKIQSLLNSEPLLITEKGFLAINNRLQQMSHDSFEILEVIREDEESFVKIIQNVAVVSIKGVIGKGLEDWEKWYLGMVDIDDVREAVKSAEVQAADYILFEINSPGGFAGGVHELSEDIDKLDKFTACFTDGEMASAAYYLGAATKHIVCSPSALVGSIGVYSVLYDSSRAYQEAGYSVEVIKSGDHKGGGVEGVPISDSYREQVQVLVDARGAKFREFVATHRQAIDFDHLQGQVYLGEEAQSLGFVDGLANSKDELIDQLFD